MSDYILAESFYRANIQTRLWYVQGTEGGTSDTVALDALHAAEHMQFGDRAYVITSKKYYIMGNNGKWYEMAI